MKTNKAQAILRNAVKKKQVVRPDKCSICGITCKPHGHHTDYDKPLEVVWACRPCHRQIHKQTGKGKNHQKPAGTQIYITDETKAKLDRLADIDQRTLDGQVHFMCNQRLKELGLPADATVPSSADTTHVNNQSQG